MPKICIDPGHGGIYTGASFAGIDEKDIVLDVGLRLKSMLIADRFEVRLTRTADQELSTNYSVDLRMRPEVARDFGADVFLSLHTNADPDEDLPGMPEARGEEIWIPHGGDNVDQSLLLANTMSKWVDKIMPDEPFRGIKQANFAVLKGAMEVGIPAAALIEVAFIDNSSSNRALSDENTRMLVALYLWTALRDYADITGLERWKSET